MCQIQCRCCFCETILRSWVLLGKHEALSAALSINLEFLRPAFRRSAVPKTHNLEGSQIIMPGSKVIRRIADLRIVPGTDAAKEGHPKTFR